MTLGINGHLSSNGRLWRNYNHEIDLFVLSYCSTCFIRISDFKICNSPKKLTIFLRQHSIYTEFLP